MSAQEMAVCKHCGQTLRAVESYGKEWHHPDGFVVSHRYGIHIAEPAKGSEWIARTG